MQYASCKGQTLLHMERFAEMEEHGMKVVVVKSPKFLSGILKMLFKIKDDK